MGSAKIGIIGTGWRADLYARIVNAIPEFELAGATARTTESAERAAERWGTAAYASPAELIAGAAPDVVVVSVPRAASPEVLETLANAGTHILAETPPAEHLADLHRLWDAVGQKDLIQVAEQYLLLPGHAARLTATQRGLIGTPTSVQVSSTHDYHAVSMMRGFLGHSSAEPVAVRTQRFEGPLVDPLSRAGWTDDPEPHPAGTLLATLDFGAGHGFYDFTDNQWHNQLRHRRITIRGSHGEIANDDLVRLAGPRQIVRSQFVRSQLGYDLNLDGYDTEHISLNGEIVWENPFLGARFMDEEIAMGAILRDTVAWARGEGAAPYPLARACQDHAIALAIHESLATGGSVITGPQPWPAA